MQICVLVQMFVKRGVAESSLNITKQRTQKKSQESTHSHATENSVLRGGTSEPSYLAKARAATTGAVYRSMDSRITIRPDDFVLEVKEIEPTTPDIGKPGNLKMEPNKKRLDWSKFYNSLIPQQKGKMGLRLEYSSSCEKSTGKQERRMLFEARTQTLALRTLVRGQLLTTPHNTRAL